MSDWAVETIDLVKTFGSFVAVDHVSMQVGKGEIFGFLGPNGAGKSTTIRILCGLLSPTSGRAIVRDLDVAEAPERVRSTIGYMSQKFSLYDDLTVAQNIDFFAGLYGVQGPLREERKRYVLEMAQLTERHDALTATLPVGLKQRLALGCAILHNPPVLFLDEPTSGVDPIARGAFWDLIREMAGAGHTIFVSTHYMDEAEYCDRLALMYRGRIIALGAPSDLRARFESHTLVQLDTTDPLETMKALEDAPVILDVAVFGGGLHVSLAELENGMKTIRSRLAARDIEIRRLEKIDPSLEDVFVTLIEAEERKQAG